MTRPTPNPAPVPNLQASEADPVDDGFCFACGRHNERGLQMRFAPQGGKSAVAHVVLPASVQGWRGVAHGGIVMTLLDEAMAHAAAAAGFRGVTAELRTRFRAPVPLETPLVVRGEVEWTRRSVLGLAATVSDADGVLLASASGKFMARGTIEPGTLGNADATPPADAGISKT